MGIKNYKSTDRLVYTEIPLAHYGTSVPFTEVDVSKGFAKYQSDMFVSGQDNPGGWRYSFDDLLKYCKVELNVFEPNRSVLIKSKDIGIPKDASTIANEVVHLGEPSGGVLTKEVHATFYNDVSTDVPIVSKISGYNALYFSILGGTRNTKYYSVGDSPNDLDFPFMRQLVIGAWQQIYGIDVSAAYDANPVNMQRTIWVQSNTKRNKYAIPSAGAIIFSGAHGSARYHRDITGNQSDPPSQTPQFINFVISGHYTTAVINTNSLSGVSFESESSTKLSMNSGGAKSFVILMGIEYGNYRAIYMKPLGGIDTFMVPKYDMDRYRLEGVSNIDGKRSRFRIFDVKRTPDDSTGTNTYCERIRRDQLELAGSGPSSMKYFDTPTNGWNIRFYFRDLLTNKVSRISDMGIIALFGNKKSKYSYVDYKIHRF